MIKIKITTTVIYFQKTVHINSLKNNDEKSFDSIIMLRFDEKKVTKEKFYGTKKDNEHLGC